MKIRELNKWAYILMAVMTVIIAGLSVYATVSSDNSLFKGPVMYILFGIYFVVQVVCIVLFRPRANVYKIGFYFTHAGVLVLLVGALLYVIFGQSIYSEVPVDKDGKYYVAIGNGDERTDLGFGIRADSLEIDYYEDGSDKYYGSDITAFDYSENTGSYHESGSARLAVNAPYRKNGWKLYFMSYNDGKYTDDGTYLLPYDAAEDGSLSPREPVSEFKSNGGTEASLTLLADSKYAGAEMAYLIYDKSASAYVPAGTDASSISSMSGLVTVRVYKSTSSENTYYVYAAQNSLLVLFKKDPGEFVVIGGMTLTMIGIVMMCLIRKRTRLSELPPVKEEDEKEGGEGK